MKSPNDTFPRIHPCHLVMHEGLPQLLCYILSSGATCIQSLAFRDIGSGPLGLMGDITEGPSQLQSFAPSRVIQKFCGCIMFPFLPHPVLFLLLLTSPCCSFKFSINFLPLNLSLRVRFPENLT